MSDAKREIAAAWRAIGATQVVAARNAKVHEDSIGRWEREQDAVYMDAYARAADSALKEVYAEALSVMREELSSDDPLARWRAANSLLNHIARLAVRRSEVVHRDEWNLKAVLLGEEADDEPSPEPVLPALQG